MTSRERRIAEHIANFNSPDKHVSAMAEQYLIRHYSGEGTSLLIEGCKHANPVVRFRAAWTLGKSRDPEAHEAILALTDDEDEGVRYDAVLALGKLGDARAIEPLKQMALAEDVTRPAWNALVDLGLTVVPIAVELYGNKSSVTRSGAFFLARRILDEFGPDDRCLGIIRAALADSDENIRSDAEFELEELGLA